MSSISKAQKRKLRDIHQKTYLEEQTDAVRAARLDILKLSIANLQIASGQLPLPLPTGTPTTGIVSEGKRTSLELKHPSWNGKSQVNRSLFVKRVNEYVADSLSQWENAKSSKRSKLVFVRGGKAIHLFSMPFFSDTVYSDEETISWNDFKKNVFYEYLRGMLDNIKWVTAEIKAQNVVKQVFAELVAENSSSSSEVRGVKYSELYTRLKSFKAFTVEDKFWKLPCWNEENMSSEVSEEEFIERWICKNGVDLGETLKQLQDEQRPKCDS